MRTYLNLRYGVIDGVYPNLLGLDIHAPASGGNHPVVLMIHGGGWERGNKSKPGVIALK